MKEHSKFLGKLSSKTQRKTVEIKVDIIEYDEEEIYYIYSPALDLIGYGDTLPAARESWELVLAEYVQYALNKKTLFKDLESRGWQVKKKNFVQPPTFSWLLENYEGLSDIYNRHDFKKTTRPITMPLAYA